VGGRLLARSEPSSALAGTARFARRLRKCGGSVHVGARSASHGSSSLRSSSRVRLHAARIGSAPHSRAASHAWSFDRDEAVRAVPDGSPSATLSRRRYPRGSGSGSDPRPAINRGGGMPERACQARFFGRSRVTALGGTGGPAEKSSLARYLGQRQPIAASPSDRSNRSDRDSPSADRPAGGRGWTAVLHSVNGEAQPAPSSVPGETDRIGARLGGPNGTLVALRRCPPLRLDHPPDCPTLTLGTPQDETSQTSEEMETWPAKEKASLQDRRRRHVRRRDRVWRVHVAPVHP